MFKLLCLCAIVVVVAGNPLRGTHWPAPGPVPVRNIEKREIPGPSQIELNRGNENEPIRAMEGQDDMDKAETFGFGYRHYYAYPRYYYPSYYYSYYPYYGYYW